MTEDYELYKRDGFVVAKKLLPPDIIDNLLRSFKKTIEARLRLMGDQREFGDLFEALVALHGRDIEVYKKVVGSLWRKEAAYRACNHPQIRSYLEDNFGWTDLFLPGGQVALLMAEELKIPNGYFGLIPHQDFPSVQGSLDGVVVWFPLVEVSQDNFPLEVIPRSHLRGLLTTLDRGSSTSEVSPDDYDENSFEPLIAEAGDVVFMSVFTLHRSSLQGQPGAFRIAMSTRFDNADEPTFIDRSFPTAYVRSVERKQLVSDFPSLAQVAAVFD